jgi:hypothetical protein
MRRGLGFLFCAIVSGCTLDPTVESLFCARDCFEPARPLASDGVGSGGRGEVADTSSSSTTSSVTSSGVGGYGGHVDEVGGSGGGSAGGTGEGGQGTGGGAVDHTPEIVATGVGSAFAMRCDGAALYWADVNAGNVVRLDLATAAPVTLFSAGAPAVGAQIALDGSGVYFTTGENGVGTLHHIAKTGGTPTDIATSAGFSAIAYSDRIWWSGGGNIGNETGVVLSWQGTINALAVDGSGVYWATSIGDIYRAHLDGSARELLGRKDAHVRPSSFMLVDAALVWNGVTASGGGNLYRMPRDGGPIVTLASGEARYLARDSGVFAWADQTSIVVLHDGSAATVLAPAISATGVTACGGWAYWSTGGRIFRARP